MVKEKLDRTYEDGFRRRAACICVRDSSEFDILLITSSRTKDCWIVPGGGIEDNETPEEAAIRETKEEAGVVGTIRRCLGDFEVFDEQMERKHRTSVFVMEVREELDKYDDVKVRQRTWFPVEKALHLLSITKPVQCTYLNMCIRTSALLWARAGHLLNDSHPSAVMNVMIKSTFDHEKPLPSKFNQVDFYSALKKDRINGGNNVQCYTFICTRSIYATDDTDGSNLDSGRSADDVSPLQDEDVVSVGKAESSSVLPQDGDACTCPITKLAHGSNQ